MQTTSSLWQGQLQLLPPIFACQKIFFLSKNAPVGKKNLSCVQQGRYYEISTTEHYDTPQFFIRSVYTHGRPCV